MSIGNNIKHRIRELGISQSDLAKLAGIPTTTLNGIITEKSLPRADNIKRIAIALHTTSDRLLFDDDELNSDDELKALFIEVNKMGMDKKRTAKNMLKALVVQNKSEELAKLQTSLQNYNTEQ